MTVLMTPVWRCWSTTEKEMFLHCQIYFQYFKQLDFFFEVSCSAGFNTENFLIFFITDGYNSCDGSDIAIEHSKSS